VANCRSKVASGSGKRALAGKGALVVGAVEGWERLEGNGDDGGARESPSVTNHATARSALPPICQCHQCRISASASMRSENRRAFHFVPYILAQDADGKIVAERSEK
jgi:hypothetical protein